MTVNDYAGAIPVISVAPNASALAMASRMLLAETTVDPLNVTR